MESVSQSFEAHAEKKADPNPPAIVRLSGDLGGTLIGPGHYRILSNLLISNGDLTLDAQGNPQAVWVFETVSFIITGGQSGGNVVLKGGALSKNIFWRIGHPSQQTSAFNTPPPEFDRVLPPPSEWATNPGHGFINSIPRLSKRLLALLSKTPLTARPARNN